ncbi:MAG: BamA/TamA family outer membrane protein [Saprospiraceae bacterium]|nr:BamA/TamA family outer membrane protein [Saprospiraceae bacterium]
MRKISVIGIPIVYYTPETRIGFGVAGSVSFFNSGKNFHKSNVLFGLAYTQNKQISIYIPYNLYFQKNRYWIYGELGYYKYLYFFYGINNCSKSDEQENYTVQFPRVRVSALKKVRSNSYIGIRWVFDKYKYLQYESNKELIKGNITGAKDGTVSGFGFLYNYDSRDHIQYPGKGSLLESMLYAESPLTGSDFTYWKLSIEFNKYFPLHWKRSVLAMQAVGVYNVGDVPFHQMALLGGSKRLRGYIDGRYRNKQMELFQAEYRIPVFWRLKMALFTGIGAIHNNLENYIKGCFVYNYGTGIRLEVDKSQKLHLRLDYGFGKNESGFYLTLGEAF